MADYPAWPRTKDPDDVLDYSINWARELAGDTISTSTWTVPSGLTEGISTKTDTETTVWLSSGTDGSSYDVKNRITTSSGRTMDQTVTLKVKAR